MYEISRYNNRKHRIIYKERKPLKISVPTKHSCWHILGLLLVCMGLSFILAGCGTVRAGNINTGSPIEGNSGRVSLKFLEDIRAKVEADTRSAESIGQPERIVGNGEESSQTSMGSTDESYKYEIDKLAYAVAVAETSNCTKGYGITHNNCHGIKKGNTYPCKTRGRSKMCNFASKEESYKAFKIIWQKWYKRFPDHDLAERWTGSDRPNDWLTNVKKAYQ